MYPMALKTRIFSYCNCVLTGYLPSKNTFSQTGNNYKLHSPKCIDNSKVSQNSTQATNFLHMKPIWTYGIQLWGTASTSNIEILESFQSKSLPTIEETPWYMPTTVIRRDLQTPTIKEEISSQCRARLSAHVDGLTVNLMELPDNRRLRRYLLNDLPTKFLV
jgi:hypothetical protein